MTTVSTDFDSVAAAVKFDSTGTLHALEHVPAEPVSVDIDSGSATALGSYDGVGDNLAFDSQDRLFISGGSDGSVHEVLGDGTLRTIKPGGLAHPTGIAVVDHGGSEAVMVMSAQALITYDGETGDLLEQRLLGFETGALQAKGGGAGLRVDGETALVTDWTPGGGVELWDLESAQVAEAYSLDFAFDVVRFQGDLVASQVLTGTVVVVEADGTAPLAGDIESPTGLAAIDGDLFVASAGSGEILRIVDDGSPLASPAVVASNLAAPEGLAVTADGNLVIVETGTGDITYVEVSSGRTTVLAEGLSPAFTLDEGLPVWGINGIAVGSSGTVYVSSPGDGSLHKISFAES